MPPGVPEAADTVAVKVTDWPKFEGLDDEVSIVEEAMALTTWPSAVEVEPL